MLTRVLTNIQNTMSTSSEILQLTKSLISIPSTKENSEALHEVVGRALQELDGFTIERFEKNNVPSALVYASPKRPKQFDLMLNAHLDVVPAKDEQYVPYITEGKLYGRGAYDMKTAAAIFILLFKQYARSLPYHLGLQLVADEEVGGFNGTKHQVEQGVRSSFTIAGEMTDYMIKHMAKGIYWLKLHTTGESAHGAYPWLGVNAVEKMNGVITRLYQTYPIPQAEVWKTTANVASVSTGNSTFNKVPDECTAMVDVRYIPEDKQKILNTFQELCGLDATVEVVVNEPSHHTPHDHKAVALLKHIAQKSIPNGGHLRFAHGASDLRHFNALGMDGVEFGPVGSGMHTDHEYVEIESIKLYTNILNEYLHQYQP